MWEFIIGFVFGVWGHHYVEQREAKKKEAQGNAPQQTPGSEKIGDTW